MLRSEIVRTAEPRLRGSSHPHGCLLRQKHSTSTAPRRRAMTNESQLRRNEEREDFYCSFFVFFVSSWSIFLRSSIMKHKHFSRHLLWLLLLFPVFADAQGTRADYERAAGLREKFQGLVVGAP